MRLAGFKHHGASETADVGANKESAPSVARLSLNVKRNRCSLHVLESRPFERGLADLNAIENLVIPSIGDLCSYPLRRLETVTRYAYPNLTNCTDGSQNQEWNYLEPAQHAQSIRQCASRKAGSQGLARNLAARTLRTEFFRNLLEAVLELETLLQESDKQSGR